MKTNVTMLNRWGTFGSEKLHQVKVPAYLPFEMYGHTFAAHRIANLDGSLQPAAQGWSVSEVKTGSRVCWGKTRKAAIANARTLLEKKGEQLFLKSVQAMLKQQKKLGRKP